jgi:methionyl-tRNA formyltransferase
MGTPGFAVPPLRRLLDSKEHQVVAVVTQPDRPVGRGQKVHMPPVKELALQHNVPVLQPEKIKKSGFDQVLSVYAPEIIVVVAYGRIIPPEVLSLPKYGCLNIHASLLPKYRGAAPIQWAIINGEKHTGVTIMHLDEGLDTGPMIAFEQVDILDDDDTQSVGNMLSVIGAELLLKVLDRISAAGKVESVTQDHSQATLAPLLEKKDGLINWGMTNEQIICRIRGLQPWPTAFSFLHGRAWKFLQALPFDDQGGLFFGEERDDHGRLLPQADPGTITAMIKGKGFTVKTGDGHLLVTQVQPPNKKPMSSLDAMNGKLVKKGDEFLSDPAFLEGTAEVE